MVDGEWSCDLCVLLHDPDVAARVMEELIRGEDLEEIWIELEERL